MGIRASRHDSASARDIRRDSTVKGKRPSAPTTAMPSHALPAPFSLTLGLLASAGLVPAQIATTPHWSTYFGGSGLEFGQAICRGPGNLITVVGTTMSSGLATTGAYQAAYGGNGDGFVARFDPSLPPGSQLLWCTYFGGSGMEIVFDVEVDALGSVVFAGCTLSPTLTTFGPADGFVARLDSTGTTLMNLVRVGGPGHTHITDLTPLGNGTFAFTGVTEPPGLTGALNPYVGIGSEPFVGCIDFQSTAPLLWTRHIGGPNGDGWTIPVYQQNGGLTSAWPGNLKRQAITTLPGGRIGAVTINNVSAPTLAGVHPAVYQSVNQGSSDIYYVELSAAGVLEHATMIGGNGTEWPKDVAPHPAGGVVITGATFSSNLPTTPGAVQTTFAGNPNDGFVIHFDPSLPTGQVRYGSYLGGDGGEDLFTRVLVEPSGLVTLAGTGYGGGTVKFPTTRGCALPAAGPSARCGAIVRLRLGTRSSDDLVFSTLFGQAWTVMHGIVLDDYGDAFVVGGTTDPLYPTTAPHQATFGGFVDACITHLPLLAGGTERQLRQFATPACTSPVYAGAHNAPWTGAGGAPGNPAYELCAHNAPPLGLGVLAFGISMPATPVFNIQALVSPVALLTVFADSSGFATFPLPIQAGVPPGVQFFTQWAFLTTPACPGSGGLLGATERLQVTTL